MSLDSRLQESVLAELRWDPSVTAAHIGVAADSGVVTLTGHVETFAEKQAAEKATHRVKGVKAVAGDIVVQLPFERIRDDGAIAAAVLERLAWDSVVPADSIAVAVSDGWVTLTGQVAWFYQKEAAAQDIARLHGVVGVSNQITVTPLLNVTDIGIKISHALHRSWLFDKDNIVVTANGTSVQLTGMVWSPAERDVALAAAWSAPGVTEVVDSITVL